MTARPAAAPLALLTLLLSGCADSTTPAGPSASGTANFASTGSPATREVSRSYKEGTFTLAGGVVGCVGEPVTVTLRQETRLQSVTDGAGGQHLLFSVVDKGSTGVGAITGAEYRVRDALTEHLQLRGAEYPATYTANFTRQFISPGSAPNFRVHNLNHFHMNADGDLTVEFGHSVRQCN